MPMKKYKPEQIASVLHQIEVEIANGKTTPQACKETEITQQTYYPPVPSLLPPGSQCSLTPPQC